ncbi:hypothetical protein KKC88_04155 [Patescibacteria group bacterium]|nr:hypothetical protein [Patescibacteria group bacterium]MBU1673162.1 hypothetical protein [Patescibacteria group bacterium]MBU1964153.1 hypothetical protein [Patescibacteria group bacterium]
MPLNPNIKRILFIAGFAGAVALMGLAIYWVFFRAPAPPAEVVEVNINVPPGLLPDVTNRPPEEVNVNAPDYALPVIDGVALGGNTITTPILDEASEFAQLGPNGTDMVYYDPADGKFYRVAPDGTILGELSDQVFPDAENVTWNPDSSGAVIEFPDGSNIFYDFDNGEQHTLPREMSDFSFSEVGEQISFKFTGIDKQDNWLGISNPDGSNAIGLTRTGENADQVDVNWSPSGQAIGTYSEFTGTEQQKVIPIGTKGENFKAMYVEGMGFDYQWSPDGAQMLYNVHNGASDHKPTLWTVDAFGDDIGKNRTPLEINTWAEKCSYASPTEIYCGVPTELVSGAGFGPGSASSTPDEIYKINLTTNTKTKIANPVDANGENNFTVEQMYTSANGEYVYFTDAQTGKIYKIKVK